MKIVILLLVALALGQCNPEYCLKEFAEIAILVAEVRADVKTSNFANLNEDPFVGKSENTVEKE